MNTFKQQQQQKDNLKYEPLFYQLSFSVKTTLHKFDSNATVQLSILHFYFSFIIFFFFTKKHKVIELMANAQKPKGSECNHDIQSSVTLSFPLAARMES